MNKTFDKTAADFFAGIGLVELGLKKTGWQVVYSLDYSQEKYEMYKDNFGPRNYNVVDINKVEVNSLPKFTLAHASFPCTDTSLAGARKGLNNGESSSFWGFIRIIEKLGENKPPLLLIENVEGFINSEKGDDLKNAIIVINQLGYSTDLLLIDAINFVPQSRKRVFIICFLNNKKQNIIEQEFILNKNNELRPKKITNFIKKNQDLHWYLRDIALLPKKETNLKDIITNDQNWWPKERAEYFLNQLSDKHRKIAFRMINNDYYSYGTAFRRMRVNGTTKKSMAELRTDGIAGCIRTPKGGSAKQILFRAGKGTYNVRLLNKEEVKLLMGAEDFYISDDIKLDKALFGLGDAVVVPVIEWLSKNYINPLFEEIISDNEIFNNLVHYSHA